jgi:hypothetical protein
VLTTFYLKYGNTCIFFILASAFLSSSLEGEAEEGFGRAKMVGATGFEPVTSCV